MSFFDKFKQKTRAEPQTSSGVGVDDVLLKSLIYGNKIDAQKAMEIPYISAKDSVVNIWNNITDFLKNHWQDLLLWITNMPLAIIKTLDDAGVWEKLGNWLKVI